MKKNAFLLLLTIILMVSCDISYFDDEIETTLERQIKVPIGSITYTLSELFQELDLDNIIEDPEGNLSFNYSQSISGEGNENYDIAIPNKSVSAEIMSPLTPDVFTAQNITSPYTIDNTIIAGTINSFINPADLKITAIESFDLSRKLTRASLIAGQLIIDISSGFSIDVPTTIEIPSLISKTEGAPYRIEQIITSSGDQITLQLSNYEVDFTHDGTDYNKTTNNFVINLEIAIDLETGDTISDNDKFSILANITGAKPDVIYGDFEQETFNLSTEELLFDFFNSFGGGKITFANPKVTIKATNGYGFPIGIDLSNLKAINGLTSVDLTYDGNQNLENILIINGIENYSSTAPAIITTTVVDNTNSNFADLLNIQPEKFEFNIVGNANPINNDLKNENFFAQDNEGFQLELDIEVPLNVTFENIEVTQSLEFNDTEDLEDFINFGLFLNTENKIPLSGNLEIIFLNNGVDLNVAKEIVAFNAADIDASGKSAGYKSTSSKLQYSEEDLEKIKNSTDIEVKITLNTAPDQPIKLSGKDDLILNIGTELTVKF